MVIKVGINGFGRVGRVVFRTCFEHSDIEISAINDPAVDVNYICYLVKFDSTHGKFNGNVTHTDSEIIINDKSIKVFHEKTPTNIPWHIAGVQYVVEASGMFTNLEKASGHLASEGVKRIIVTAPSVDVPMLILGVNEHKINSGHKVISCGSSTLYCLAPIVKVLEDKYGVEDGFITSIHAMTPSLKPLDGLCLRGKHWRDHRSIHQNIIPATTGACKALGKILPAVRDKITGLAFRVPIVNVSVLDLTIRLTRDTSLEDIVKIIEQESKSSMENIIKISKDEAVSSDFAGDSHSCIVDADSSLQLKPNYYKLICWYENEYSYACRVMDTIFFSEKQLISSELKTKMTYVKSKLKKQNSIQQTDCCIKKTSLDRAYTIQFTPKVLCSTSHNEEFKNKLHSRPVLSRKQFTQNSGATSCSNSPISNKRELFKIWNDDNIEMTAAKHKQNNFFQSCIMFRPNDNITKTHCTKAQERLEKVKKEFSKMVNITEDLLKKSCNSRQHLSNTSDLSKEEHININNTKMILKEFDKNYCSNAQDTSKKSEMSDPTLDFRVDSRISASTLNSNVVNGKDSNDFYEKDMSEYSVPVSETAYVFKSDDSISHKKEKSNNENTADVKFATNNTCSDIATDNAKVKESPNIRDFKNHVTKTINTIMDGLSNNFQFKPYITNANKDVRKTNNIESFQVQNTKNTGSSTINSTRNSNNKYDNTLTGPDILKDKNTLLNDSSDKNLKDVKYEKRQCNEMINGRNTNMVNINLLDGELKTCGNVLTSYDLDLVNNSEHGHVRSQCNSSEINKCNISLVASSKESKPEDIKNNKKPEESAKTVICYDNASAMNTVNICVEAGDYQQDKEMKDVNFETYKISDKSGDFSKINKLRDVNLESDDIIIVSDDSQQKSKLGCSSFETQNNSVETESCKQVVDLQKANINSINALVLNLTKEVLSCSSQQHTVTISNDVSKNKQDIYDKLDSASTTDSDISLHIDGRRSQVINITDLTNSLEDLERLDKICRIIEISDELSDKLFSSLNNDDVNTKANKKWSFKDLCEKINLDEFCTKVFGKSI